MNFIANSFVALKFDRQNLLQVEKMKINQHFQAHNYDPNIETQTSKNW